MDIYVGNLPYNFDQETLEGLFAEHGEVASAKIIMDRETNRSKGFGFVEMPNADEANKAIEALNGADQGGRSLRVNEAQPRAPRPRRF